MILSRPYGTQLERLVPTRTLQALTCCDRLLIRRIGLPAHEQDAVGAIVANQEDKGMVGAENRWRRRVRRANCHGPHGHGGGRRCFGSFLVDIDISLMDHRRNKEIAVRRSFLKNPRSR